MDSLWGRAGWRSWGVPVVAGLVWGVGFPLATSLTDKATPTEALIEGVVLGPLWFLAFGPVGAWARRRFGERNGDAHP
jgi:hypothetical protein